VAFVFKKVYILSKTKCTVNRVIFAFINFCAKKLLFIIVWQPSLSYVIINLLLG